MISLDMKTVLAIFVVINLITLAVIALLWRQNRKHFDGLNFWVIDHALQLLAMILIILRGKIPDFLSMVLSNTMIVAGLLLLYMGLQRFVGKKSSQIHNYIFLAIFFLVHSYFTIIQPNLSIRTINTSVGLMIIGLQCFLLLIRKEEPNIRQVTRDVAISFVFISLVNIARIVFLFVFPPSSSDFFQFPAIDTLLLIILYLICFIFLPFTLIMMVSGRLTFIANKNEEHYRQLFELESDAIILVDKGAINILDANQATERMYGYTHNEILTLSRFDISAEPELTKKSVEQDLKYIPVIYHKKKDGTIFPVELIISNTEFHDRIVQIIAIRDITLRIQAEEQYRQIVETANEGICIMDKDFRITFVNQQVIDMLGYGMEEMIGSVVSDFMLQDDLKDHQDQQELRKQGEGAIYERRLRCKDGSEIMAIVSSKPFFDGLGKFSGSFAMFTDITKRRQAETALNNQYAILKSIIDSPNTPVFSVDNNYCYTSYNASHAEIMKLIYGVDIQIGKNILNYMSVEEDRNKAKENFDRILNGERFTTESYSGEESLSRLYFEVSHNPVTNSEREIIGAAIFAKDISDRKLAEEKLRDNEERYRNVIALAGGVAYQRDWQNEIYTFMDEGIQKLTGYSSDEMTPELFNNIVDRENPDDIDKEFLRSGISQQIIEESPTLYKSEFRITTKDNQIKYVSDSSIKFRNANNEIIQSLGMLQDITRHKQYEQEIISIARFPSENPNPVLRISADGNIIYGNNASKILQDIWNGNYNSSDLPKWKEAFDKVLDTGKSDSVEISYHDRIFSLAFVPINERGYVNVYGLDITDRKKAEEKLIKSEQLYRSAIESANAIPYLRDHNLGDRSSETYEFMGIGIKSLTGYDTNEFTPEIYDSMVQEIILYGELANLSADEATRKFYEQENAIWRADVRIKIRDGKDKWLIDSSVNISNEEDGLYKTLGIMLDITDRKQAEEVLKQKMQELARSNAELQQFAYVSSHDLQEPLRKIQAFGDLLKNKYGMTIDERGQDYIQRMQDASGRMQTLINDLLAYSRIATKALPYTSVNLTNLLNDVASDLVVRIRQTGGSVEISDMPTIDADQSQMYQLFQNLISNGLKFHRPDVPPIIKVYSEIQNNICNIFVEDNGIGFDEKYLDRIFVIFQRLQGRSEYEGTGVGLAICRKIVDRHNGSITAKSKQGEGSTFIVTMPVKQL
jgi:PAS domain S-box-containing protein